MRILFLIPAALLLTAGYFRTETQTKKTLEIYVVDVEGGNATLIIPPSQESVLIDTGNLGASLRDAGRIMEAVNDAGLTQIDHLITTHWHLDHFGGMAEVARRIPVREFIDHGPNKQPNKKADTFLEQTYPSLYRNAKHTIVKAGETIPIQDLNFKVVASAGETIKQSLPLAGLPNPYCANFKREAPDQTENAQSIGSYMTFGKFRALHLGDLSSDKEFDLMCPDNRIGTVDLWVVSHHGQTNSNTEVLVHAIESRVAIMNNGIRKGGEAEIMRIIHSAPGLENLWQLHFSQLSGQEYTVPGMFIANLTDKPQPTVAVAPMTEQKLRTAHSAAPTHNGKAYWIKVSAQLDGSFTVTNGRTGFSKVYRAQVE
jgi:beta-lactamase superfamily II metal-dependent hydrolase